MNNSTTAQDLLHIHEALATDTLVAPQANRMMVNILKDEAHNDMFPLALPENSIVAHKTGWITNLHHDSGIIYLPGGSALILVVLSQNAPDRDAVLAAGARIARLCDDYESR